MARILLIEDDPLIRDSLAMALRRHGHEVRVAASGEEGLSLAADGVELVVLDVMLPGMDGFEVCRRLRARGDVAVIMLTAREDDIDVVGGLEAGADDYVVKPVLPRVLDARIKAVLRRGGRDVQSGTVRFGELEIDRDGLTVAKNGVAVALTRTELRLLLELSGAPGQVFSRQQLLERVWEHDYLGDSRLVDNGIQRLRAKIEGDPAAPLFVQTVRGFGYRFGPI